jgi:hypothetical protein
MLPWHCWDKKLYIYKPSPVFWPGMVLWILILLLLRNVEAAVQIDHVGYCHAVAHSLGGQYHIPHGLAKAVLLAYILESYGESVYNKCRDLAVAMGIQELAHYADKEADPLYPVPKLMNGKELERFYYDVMEEGK